MGDVKVVGDLGHRDTKLIELLIPEKVKRELSELDFWRAAFVLLRTLVDRVPWETVLKDKGVQEGWTIFKKEILKAQEQAIPAC